MAVGIASHCKIGPRLDTYRQPLTIQWFSRSAPTATSNTNESNSGNLVTLKSHEDCVLSVVFSPRSIGLFWF